jgi:hypothetical protein
VSIDGVPGAILRSPLGLGPGFCLAPGATEALFLLFAEGRGTTSSLSSLTTVGIGMFASRLSAAMMIILFYFSIIL